MCIRTPLSWPEFLLRLFGALIVLLVYAYWRWRKDTKKGK